MRNGLLLSAGVSYQALFATFAALSAGFALFGVWFVGSDDRLDSLIRMLNTVIPGLIGSNGAISRDQLIELAQTNIAQLGWSGALALVVLVWTASSWMTTTRVAIRAVLGLPHESRSLAWLKLRDVLTSLGFGAVFLVAAALSSASTNLFATSLEWLGINRLELFPTIATRLLGLVLVTVLNTAILGLLFRTQVGGDLRTRDIRIGAAVGGAALTALQVLSSFALAGIALAPLLATFVVFATLLLWFRLTAIVTLAAAAWVAEAAADRGRALQDSPR